MVSFASDRTKGSENTGWGQEKQAAAKGQESLRKATDTLSTMLAQEVKDLTPASARPAERTAPTPAS